MVGDYLHADFDYAFDLRVAQDGTIIRVVGSEAIADEFTPLSASDSSAKPGANAEVGNPGKLAGSVPFPVGSRISLALRER